MNTDIFIMTDADTELDYDFVKLERMILVSFDLVGHEEDFV